jgi:hypothetical protein
MKLENEDLLVVVLKNVSSNGMNRYFEVYKYNFEDNNFKNVTYDVSDITEYKISRANNSKQYGCLIVGGVGMNMSKALIDTLYKKYNLQNPSEIQDQKYDSFNKDTLVLNIANKDNKTDKKYYNLISSPFFQPTTDNMIDFFRDRDSLKEYILKNNLHTDKDFISQNAKFLKFADESLKNDKDFVTGIIKKSYFTSDLFTFLPNKYLEDKEFIKQVVAKDSSALAYKCEKIINDKQFMSELIGIRTNSYMYGGKTITDDAKLTLKACLKEPYMINHSSQRLRTLCYEKDPIKVLNSLILQEKLQMSMVKKPEVTTKRHKI